MKYEVIFSDEARRDLADLYHYVLIADGSKKADALLSRLESLCLKLEHLPLRGHPPPELERIGVALYREVHYKAYRVIYQIQGKIVVVHAVIDGRRDLQDVLQRRFIR